MKESSKLALDLHFLEMDLQSLQSVKVAAAGFMKRESQLDLLVNNAGVSILLEFSNIPCHAASRKTRLSSFQIQNIY